MPVKNYPFDRESLSSSLLDSNYNSYMYEANIIAASFLAAMVYGEEYISYPVIVVPEFNSGDRCYRVGDKPIWYTENREFKTPEEGDTFPCSKDVDNLLASF